MAIDEKRELSEVGKVREAFMRGDVAIKTKDVDSGEEKTFIRSKGKTRRVKRKTYETAVEKVKETPKPTPEPTKKAVTEVGKVREAFISGEAIVETKGDTTGRRYFETTKGEVKRTTPGKAREKIYEQKVREQERMQRDAELTKIQAQQQFISQTKGMTAKEFQEQFKTTYEPGVGYSIVPKEVISKPTVSAGDMIASQKLRRYDPSEYTDIKPKSRDAKIEQLQTSSVISVDTRSGYQKAKSRIKYKLGTQGETEGLTAKEMTVFPVVAAAEGSKAALKVAKGFFITGLVGTLKAFTVDLPSTAKTLFKLATGDVATFRQVYSGASEAVIQRPFESLGEAAFGEVAPLVLSKTTAKIKNVYVKAGSKYIPPEKVFAETVLDGTEHLPKASSTAESLERFGKTGRGVKDVKGYTRAVIKDVGDFSDNNFIFKTDNLIAVEQKVKGYTTKNYPVVQTSSPAKIKGTQAGLGRKGAVGLEDPGIYVTPAGEGSPYFLRIGDEALEYGLISSNPFADIKKAFEVPTVTRAKTQGVSKLPRDVIQQPGFEPVKAFQETQVGQGKAFITKRSEIGQGEIPRQFFEATEDFNIDVNLRVERGGVKIKTSDIKKGDIMLEAGTSEIEAVIPSGQSFQYIPKTFLGKIKGFDYYTEFKGAKVAVRDTILTTEKGKQVVSSTFSTIDKAGKRTPTPSVLSGKQISSEASYLYGEASQVGVSSPYLAAGYIASQVDIKKRGPAKMVIVGEESKDIISSTIVSKQKTPKPTLSVSITSKQSQVPISAVYPSLSKSSKGISSPSSVVSKPSSIISKPSIISSPSSIISKPSIISSPSSKISNISKIKYPSYDYSGYGGGDIIRPRPLSIPKPKKKEKKRKEEFLLQVRRKGKFQTVGKSFTNVEKAFQVGKSRVSQTAAASFRVLKATSKQAVVPAISGKQFRVSQKEAGVVIQKREYRISTFGERKEITAKGLQVQKSKRFKNGF